MPYFDFFWTDEIIEHLAEHGVTSEDFERVVQRPVDVRASRSSDLPAAFGYTEDGRYIIAIYDFIDDVTVLPVTAYEVPEPQKEWTMEQIKIRKRIHGKLTPALQRRLEKARAQVAEELPDLIRRNQLGHDARKEKTLSGAIRRAVHAFPLSPMKIAELAEISWRELDDFLTAEKTLPSDAIDRLVKVVRLKLPASKAPQRRAKAS